MTFSLHICSLRMFSILSGVLPLCLNTHWLVVFHWNPALYCLKKQTNKKQSMLYLLEKRSIMTRGKLICEGYTSLIQMWGGFSQYTGDFAASWRHCCNRITKVQTLGSRVHITLSLNQTPLKYPGHLHATHTHARRIDTELRDYSSVVSFLNSLIMVTFFFWRQLVSSGR